MFIFPKAYSKFKVIGSSRSFDAKVTLFSNDKIAVIVSPATCKLESGC